MREVRAHAAAMPELAFFHSVPNSTRTTAATAARMAREGATRGVHDLHWDLCRGGWTGLTIEMKAAGKTLEEPQKRFAAFYASQGVLALRCTTDAEAWAAVLWYYRLLPTPAAPRAPLPAMLAHTAAPTAHRRQGDAARLAANAKRRATVAANAKRRPTAAAMLTGGPVPAPKPRAVKYPVRG